jgi:hypothetical protein
VDSLGFSFAMIFLSARNQFPSESFIHIHIAPFMQPVVRTGYIIQA